MNQAFLFENVVERYVRYILPHRVKDLARQTRLLDFWKDEFRGVDIRKIKASELTVAKEKLLSLTSLGIQVKNRSGDGTVAVNRSLARLKNLFTVCQDEWEYCGNPARRVKLYKETTGKTKFLTLAQILTFLLESSKSKNKELYLAARMILSSGARKNEVMQMKFEDIDFENLRGDLARQKNGEPGYLYFDEDIIQLIKDLPRKSGFIFTKKNIYFGMKQALERAGLEGFTIHDLRHTFASHLAMDGASTLMIKDALRLKTLKLTQRYAHHAPSTICSRVRHISKNWKVSPEDRGWVWKDGETLAPKFPGTLL